MNWLNDVVPYKIETERLIIKCWEPKYAKDLNELIIDSSESLLPWMPFAKAPFPTISEEVNIIRQFRGEYDLNEDYTLGIFDKNKDSVIGSAGLHTRQGKSTLEIGYWIGKQFENTGYATEVSSALIKVAFEISDIERVEINTAADNFRSKNVIKKLDMHFEGVLRRATKDAYGVLHDSEKYSIIREEYVVSKHKGNNIKCFSVNNEIIAIY